MIGPLLTTLGVAAVCVVILVWALTTWAGEPKPFDKILDCGCADRGVIYSCMYCARSHCGGHSEHVCQWGSHASTAMAALTPDETELDVHERRHIAHTLARLDRDDVACTARMQAVRRDSYRLSDRQVESWKQIINDDFEGTTHG